MITITCGQCGETSPFEDWTATPIGGDLPPGTYQCPACHRAIKRCATGGWRTLRAPNGSTIHIPERIELKPVQSRL